MKVLLVRPIAPNKLSFTKILENEPLELEYLHTALSQIDVSDSIYDGLIEERKFEDALLEEKPDVVAITGYITQENLMLSYCSLAKKRNPAIVTILGGVHAQLNFKRMYQKDVDYIARSESMDAFSKLILFIKTGEGDLSVINGLCYKSGGEFVETKLFPTDINELPIPDRTFFYQNKKHFRYLDLTEVATIKTSFSCPYDCTFCYCTLLGGGKYRTRNLDLVIEELESLDCKNVQIADDDFLVDKVRLREFIRLVREKNIKKTFICYARADFVAENEEIIKELVDIGFYYFLVGLEAVSDSELNDYNKKTSVDMNRRCVEVIHSTKAHCIALMIAPIDATKAYFRNLYKWISDNNLKYVTVSFFTPIPGTPLYDEYKDQLTSDNIEDWDFLHLVMEPKNLTRRQFYFEYYRLFVKLYKIAKKTGIYDFMDLKFYKKLLASYLKRKIWKT